jgi:hypothetical protein
VPVAALEMMMSFDGYLKSIETKTGKRPEDFHELAKEKGLTGAGVKAAQLVDWLKADFGLGHGHAMAIWAVFKREGWAG